MRDLLSRLFWWRRGERQGAPTSDQRLLAAQHEAAAIRLRKALLAAQVQATIRRLEGTSNGH